MFIQNTYKIITEHIEKNQGIIFSILTAKSENVLDSTILLRTLLQKKQIHNISVIDLKEKELSLITQELSMSFLGSQKCYFLLNFDLLNIKQKNEYTTFLTDLKSPHIIFIFTQTMMIKNTISCSISPEYTPQEAREFIEFFSKRNQKQIDRFLPLLKTKKGKTTLEALLRSLQYIQVVSSNSDEFFQQWALRIFKSDDSFFNLMEYFFAQDTKKFLEAWGIHKNKYSFSFWTTAFSQQLFKAVLIVMAKQQNKIPDKKIEFRLPFTFLNKDWKLHSIEKLVHAHHEICMIDIKFKQGEIREDALELFCIKFTSSSLDLVE